jgi:hypothetical protein
VVCRRGDLGLLEGRESSRFLRFRRSVAPRPGTCRRSRPSADSRCLARPTLSACCRILNNGGGTWTADEVRATLDEIVERRHRIAHSGDMLPSSTATRPIRLSYVQESRRCHRRRRKGGRTDIEVVVDLDEAVAGSRMSGQTLPTKLAARVRSHQGRTGPKNAVICGCARHPDLAYPSLKAHPSSNRGVPRNEGVPGSSPGVGLNLAAR